MPFHDLLVSLFLNALEADFASGLVRVQHLKPLLGFSSLFLFFKGRVNNYCLVFCVDDVVVRHKVRSLVEPDCASVDDLSNARVLDLVYLPIKIRIADQTAFLYVRYELVALNTVLRLDVVVRLAKVSAEVMDVGLLRAL